MQEGSDVWTVFIEVPWNQNQSINNITNNTTKKVQAAKQSTVMQTQMQDNFETKLKIAMYSETGHCSHKWWFAICVKN